MVGAVLWCMVCFDGGGASFSSMFEFWPVGGALEPRLVLESSRRSGAEPPIHPTPTSLAQTVFGIPKEIFLDKLRQKTNFVRLYKEILSQIYIILRFCVG